MRALALVAFGVGLACGVSANEPVLTVTTGGNTLSYAPAVLLALPAAGKLTVAHDVAYQREMTFQAVPVADVLGGVRPDETIRFVTRDGFVASLPAAALLARGDGAVAYLAVETTDAPWPALKASDPATAGPFYLVWQRPGGRCDRPRTVAVPDRPHRIRRAARQALSDGGAGGDVVRARPGSPRLRGLRQELLGLSHHESGGRRDRGPRSERSVQSHGLHAPGCAPALDTRSAIIAQMAQRTHARVQRQDRQRSGIDRPADVLAAHGRSKSGDERREIVSFA